MVMYMYKNVLVLRKYSLKYLGVNKHDVFITFKWFMEERENDKITVPHRLPTLGSIAGQAAHLVNQFV